MKTVRISVVTGLALGVLSLARADAASDRQLAERLLDLFGIEQRLPQITEALVQVEIESDPSAREFADVYRQFFADTVGWDKLKPELARVLMQEFSAEELRSIVAFFESNVGRKYTAVSLTLPQKISVVTEGLLNAKAAELRKRIEQRRREAVQRDLNSLDKP